MNDINCILRKDYWKKTSVKSVSFIDGIGKPLSLTKRKIYDIKSSKE